MSVYYTMALTKKLLNNITFLLQVEGTSLRSRSLSYKTTLCDEFYNKIFPRFIDGHGTFKVFIDREYDWKDITDAHRYMEANENIGKIVVNVVD